MAIYGVTLYGQEVYGYVAPPDYRIDPFTATSINYTTVGLSWIKPAGDILAYRLIRNRYGYPSDQDDGEILIDSENYPGSQYQDNSVIPGQYHYYGFYVLLDFEGNIWVKSGITACLAIQNWDSYSTMYNLMPGYFTNAASSGDELTADAVGNTYLQQFTQVVSWGIDYLRTQYSTYANVNNPWTVPLSSLYNLATELGLDINPDITTYTLRKAVYYNATINQQRGTLSGIETEVSALTGWNLDLQVGPNTMLENDQSYFADPVYADWSAHLNYDLGERVTYSGSDTYIYQCIDATANIGSPPTGTTSSNTYWEAVLGVHNNTILENPATGNPDTWELLFPSLSNGAPPANSVYETIGIENPLDAEDYTHNGLIAINNESGAENIWLRSVSRTTADMDTVTTTFAPDKYQAVADGVPIPYSLPSQVWNDTTWYSTNDIVTYNSQPFIALRANYGEQPPYSVIGSSNDWMPLSWDQRYRLCISAENLGSSSVEVTPFVEWYDNQGNYIMRVLARNPTPGTVAVPNNLVFDSFTTGAGEVLSGRTTDDGGYTWITETGHFTMSPFANGCVFPTVTGQKSYALINAGVSNTQVGVTFVTSPEAGQTQGIVLRWSSDANYLLAGLGALYVKNAGAWSTAGTYSTPFAAGDRMVVQLNGTSVTVLRNGTSVLAATSSFNETATYFGIDVENTP